MNWRRAGDGDKEASDRRGNMLGRCEPDLAQAAWCGERIRRKGRAAASALPIVVAYPADTMIAARTAVVATRTAARPVAQQKRGIINYLTNYPDKVMETKKLQTAGGTCLGDVNPTWLKQPGDMAVALFGLGLTSYGLFQAVIGHYRLATGKGKKD
eukprot:CAMPEP_0183327108 /NCGR_PEP_ID=MMETSP0160_2-20130417/83591_1 /TAXON_ID=2839 ORGANISM="Odontella Sinensis, Strain Grunow 1884" /NCGR_SAMPLE_ID=MMETSP0160_2 /ASSEMBLY_ACC=CAM_ASM_000250 /LENGTH=155 /DNA_ID=CAMNT_0025495221 /DNA_START=301 /DNA_END=768 /DNA_ORIENTATION=-